MVIFFYPSATYVKVPPGGRGGKNGSGGRGKPCSGEITAAPPSPRPRKTAENTGKEYCKNITPPVAKIPLAGLPDLPCFQKSSFRKMDAGHIFRKFFCFVQTV